ncbi:hypothetical protein R5R35_005259 [Gryllus longicercus]|uniref:Metalloendopeptidase n=1 Tax=Gryllus longicercus TaxID=2509291 RepID=A0AAN9VQ56_9ORTH
MKTLLIVLLAVAGTLSLPLFPGAEESPLWERSGKFEGDIILNSQQRNSIARNGLTSAYSSYRWSGRTIPYKFASSVSASVQATIRNALEEYNTKTCVKVREATSADRDYVLVTSDNSGCWSYVGRQGGQQQLNLQHSLTGTCLSTGTIVHEFLHAAGFYHQQSAADRDDFVTIVWSNIQSGYEGNFEKYTTATVTDFGVQYDYSSVMHYSAVSFSKNGQATIVPKDPNATIGQRVGFSEGDILKLNRMYGCE